MYYVPCNTLQMVISAQGPKRDCRRRTGTQEFGPQHGKKHKKRKKPKDLKDVWEYLGPKVRENDRI